MRYVPSRRKLFDGWQPLFESSTLTNADVHEKDGRYLIDIALPGFERQDLKVTLNHGTLTVMAKHHELVNEDEAAQQLHPDPCRRSWYVGESVKPDDIHASYKEGVLHLDFPAGSRENTENPVDIL